MEKITDENGKVLHNGFVNCHILGILKDVNADVNWDDVCNGLEDVFGEQIKNAVNKQITLDLEYIKKMKKEEVMEKVKTFKDFTTDNDPHGEHDFGSFTLRENKFFWKIDYYNKDNPDMGSEDPSNTKITLRILTIMLAKEY